MDRTIKNEKIRIFALVTRNCNFKCRYCETYKDPGVMTPATASRLCDLLKNSLKSFERISLFFFGGEPLLKFNTIKDITESLKKCKIRHRFDLFVITNGSALNKQMAVYLKENDIAVNLSVDGTPETQDYNRLAISRLRSSHEQVAVALKFLDLKDWGKHRITALMTFYPSTVSSLFKDFVHLLRMGIVNFNFTPAISAYDAWCWNKKDSKILKEELKKVAVLTIRLKFKGLLINLPRVPGNSQGPPNLAKWVGNNNIGVDVNGDIYSSDSFMIMPDWLRHVLLLGNIFYEKNFSRIYKNRHRPEEIAKALTLDGRYLKKSDIATQSVAVRDKVLRNAQHQ